VIFNNIEGVRAIVGEERTVHRHIGAPQVEAAARQSTEDARVAEIRA
jgi:hypothetical protein